jgi:hypothetical protein
MPKCCLGIGRRISVSIGTVTSALRFPKGWQSPSPWLAMPPWQHSDLNPQRYYVYLIGFRAIFSGLSPAAFDARKSIARRCRSGLCNMLWKLLESGGQSPPILPSSSITSRKIGSAMTFIPQLQEFSGPKRPKDPPPAVLA